MIYDDEFTHEQDAQANSLRQCILNVPEGDKIESISFFEFFGIENDLGVLRFI